MLFPEFQRTVTITDRKNREHQIRMLPISLYDDYIAIMQETADAIKNEGRFSSALVHGRKKLRKLAMAVMPRKLRRELMYFDYDQTAMIVNFLFHGGDAPLRSTAPDGAEKGKPDPTRQLDFQLQAAKILTMYPGYTLETLLAEPMPVFFKLAALAPRVQADRALSELIPAVSAVINGGKSYDLLREVAGDRFIEQPAEKSYTDEEYQAAIDRMNNPDLKTVRERKIGSLM